MFTLLLTVVLGVLLSIFATQNTNTVSVNFGGFILPGVPVYLVVLIPLLIGTLIAFFLHSIRNLIQGLAINEGKSRITNLKTQLAEVTKHAHELEIKNSKLEKARGTSKDENSI